MRVPAIAGAALVAGSLLLAAACGSTDDGDGDAAGSTAAATGETAAGTGTAAPRPALADVRAEVVADGLDAPLLAISPPGDGRLFAVEQGGRVWRIDGGRAPEPYLDLSSLTAADGEQGLLGLAFHPGFAENGRLFVNLTDPAGDTRILELTAEPDAERVDAGTAREILAVDQPYTNHNGGEIAFGPDGLLYAGLGDGGSGGDPEDRAQDTSTLLGKILRIDVDSGSPYGIPPGNPFADGEGGRPEILITGVRNPWRFAFDPDGGDLWIGDVGQNAVEEIDRVPLADAAGANLGWNIREGSIPFEDGPLPEGYIGPAVEYGHHEGCSVTGGVVNRGEGALAGRYLYGDYCAGRVLTVSADGAVGTPRDLPGVAAFRELRSFGVDAGGATLVVAGDGVYRLADGG